MQVLQLSRKQPTIYILPTGISNNLTFLWKPRPANWLTTHAKPHSTDTRGHSRVELFLSLPSCRIWFIKVLERIAHIITEFVWEIPINTIPTSVTIKINLQLQSKKQWCHDLPLLGAFKLPFGDHMFLKQCILLCPLSAVFEMYLVDNIPCMLYLMKPKSTKRKQQFRIIGVKFQIEWIHRIEAWYVQFIIPITLLLCNKPLIYQHWSLHRRSTHIQIRRK